MCNRTLAIISLLAKNTMSQCAVYRSNKKTDTYLYVRVGFDYQSLPKELITLLGETEHVMELDLSQRDSLAHADINQVKSSLAEHGYYLQLPPKVSIETLLSQH